MLKRRLVNGVAFAYHKTMPSSLLLYNELYLFGTVFLRLAAGVLVFLFGLWIARRVTGAVRRAWQVIMRQDIIAASPVGSLFEHQSLRGSGLLSQVVYWSVVFIFTALAGEMLGITLFSNILQMILAYIPNVLSALVVFILGAVAAGVIEKVVKQQVKPWLPEQSVLIGTFASSTTLTLFGLIALSELGVASQFILVLFAGFVFAAALAVGIAVGFGAKDLVASTLSALVQQEAQQRERGRATKTSSKK